jgi:hypothetical protein
MTDANQCPTCALLRAENEALLERIAELYRAQKSRILSARSAEYNALTSNEGKGE